MAAGVPNGEGAVVAGPANDFTGLLPICPKATGADPLGLVLWD